MGMTHLSRRGVLKAAAGLGLTAPALGSRLVR